MAPARIEPCATDKETPLNLQAIQAKSSKFNSPVDVSNYQLLDQLFRHRAADPCQVPLLAFPRCDHADFEYFTGRQLDRFTDTAAWNHHNQGLSSAESNVVGILGPTDIDWVITLFALSRAGKIVLILSPRLSAEAITKLTQETQCRHIIYRDSGTLSGIVKEVEGLSRDIKTLRMLTRDLYDDQNQVVAPFTRHIQDVSAESSKTCIIMHSAGSTGLPKPTGVTHSRFTTLCPLGEGTEDLLTLPLSHAFGITVTPARMYLRKTVFLVNPNLPLTSDGLTSVIHASKPQTMCTVPYALKLLAEQPSGIEALRVCDRVLSTGSQCPDALGDRLVEQGVHLGVFLGSSECSFIGESFSRPKEDKDWAFLRLPPQNLSNVEPQPIGDGLYEFVFLKDFPDRVVTNSDDPPQSYHSKDVFAPHPTDPNRWKYISRIDDRITLLNGEKVLPLPIEGRIRQHPLVREVSLFGIGRAIPGLLLFRADQAKELTDDAFVDAVWPVIEQANSNAESFSQITREMVVSFPAAIDLPITDKGTLIRSKLYQVFDREINEAYDGTAGQSEGTTVLDHADLETYLLDLSGKILDRPISNPTDDLFSLGMNSLQAIQMRGTLLKHLDLGGNSKMMSQNVIFEQGNIAKLASHLETIRLGKATRKEKPIEMMKEMILEYSVKAPGAVILLTGATGSLGAHLLATLLSSPSVSHIYCLIRGANPSDRLTSSLASKGITLPPRTTSKFTTLTSSLHEPHLGLSPTTYNQLETEITHIIHPAYPVNFSLSLPSFAPSLTALQNLLTLSLPPSRRNKPPANLAFMSSISVALDAPPSANPVPESPLHDFGHVSGTGYAQSKFVAEKIVERAVRERGANARVYRIGQIVGDTENGVWNEGEMYPAIIRGGVAMGVMPRLQEEEEEEWLPVDVCARAVLEVEGLFVADGDCDGEDEAEAEGEERRMVYNILSPHSFSWSRDLLPALSNLGLAFETISFDAWLDKLRHLAASHPHNPDQSNGRPDPAADPARNPALKLIDFFEENFSGQGGGGVRFATEAARRASPSLRESEDVITSGLLAKMVGVWMEKWGKEEGEGDGGEGDGEVKVDGDET